MPSPWLLAIRPKTLPAAAAPVVLGTAIAAHAGVLRWPPALAALAGALLIQIATNLANDYFDFVKGADTEERVGPTRVTQAGLLSPEAVRRAMLLTLGAATVVGAYLVAVGGVPILVVGLAALLCAVAYTGGPYPLAYHGLGDLFVFVFFGLVAVAGTVYVQALEWLPQAVWAGAGVGAVSTALLVVNNLRDIDTDRRAGKRTLATRLGVAGTRVEYTLLWAVAMGVPVVGIGLFGWPSTVLLSLLGVVVAGRAMRLVWTGGTPEQVAEALPPTAAGLMAYAAGFAVGLVLG
ncbi:MAG TPA: 1,4-dihydroxy-2-naphthoate polyprenyltransferase [Longimicrobiales bacterium]|nr:1,4-dihydroxy-2-naphthoate polyprenyltransferase [Longimicrobiales bacterium]